MELEVLCPAQMVAHSVELYHLETQSISERQAAITAEEDRDDSLSDLDDNPMDSSRNDGRGTPVIIGTDEKLLVPGIVEEGVATEGKEGEKEGQGGKEEGSREMIAADENLPPHFAEVHTHTHTLTHTLTHVQWIVTV